MSQRQSGFSRRRFLQTAGKAGAMVAAPLVLPGQVLGLSGAVAASERIVMAGVGLGGRGTGDLKTMLGNPDVQFIAISDTREEQRQAIKEIADNHHGNKDCKTYHDFRELLARPDIDGVLIATGDRWHTMASITAAKAGKDIYCEKPCSVTIAQSRALADVVNRYGCVYQAGTQRRTIDNFIFAANLAHSGKLGKLHTVHANTLAPATTHEWLPAEPQPPKSEVDWDMWLGPCPWRPYNSQYIRGRWRGHFDFHGGGILEWGSHTVDLCQWAAQADHTAPVEYEPDGNHIHARYADGVKLIMRDTGWMGLGTCSARYEGDEGWVETGDTGRISVFPDSLHSEVPTVTMRGTDPLNHIRNFLDCVKSRALPAANASVVAQSHIASHAAYIAWQLGRKVQFDPVKEEFLGDQEANQMRSRAMREPWHI